MILSNRISGQYGNLPSVCGLANIQSSDFEYLLDSLHSQRSAHAVATLLRCSGFSACFANKKLPDGRRDRLYLLIETHLRICGTLSRNLRAAGTVCEVNHI